MSAIARVSVLSVTWMSVQKRSSSSSFVTITPGRAAKNARISTSRGERSTGEPSRANDQVRSSRANGPKCMATVTADRLLRLLYLRGNDRIAFELAGDSDFLAGVGCQPGHVLIGDLQHFVVGGQEHVFRAAVDAIRGALLGRRRRDVFRTRFVF